MTPPIYGQQDLGQQPLDSVALVKQGCVQTARSRRWSRASQFWAARVLQVGSGLRMITSAFIFVTPVAPQAQVAFHFSRSPHCSSFPRTHRI